MKTKLMTLALATILAAGCSAEPEDEDAVIIMFEGDEASDATDEVPDMGSMPDQGTSDPSDMGVEPLEDLAEMEPDLPGEVEPTGTMCAAKDAPVQLINTCVFEWGSCEDGTNYAFECDIQNLAGNVFSLCNCFENGVKDEADKIVDICGAADWAEVEAIVNEQCGWDLH